MALPSQHCTEIAEPRLTSWVGALLFQYPCKLLEVVSLHSSEPVCEERISASSILYTSCCPASMTSPECSVKIMPFTESSVFEAWL